MKLSRLPSGYGEQGNLAIFIHENKGKSRILIGIKGTLGIVLGSRELPVKIFLCLKIQSPIITIISVLLFQEQLKLLQRRKKLPRGRTNEAIALKEFKLLSMKGV